MHDVIKKWLAYEPRRVRPPGHSIYPLTVNLITDRMKIMLPPSLVRNKSILDLGCGIPFNEYWCTSHGAKLFHGVEVLQKLAKQGNQLVRTPNYIFNDSIENFIQQADLQKYDLIIAQSSLSAVDSVQDVFRKLFESKATIVFEMNNCLSTEDAVIHYNTEAVQATDTINEVWKVQKSFPNMGAVQHFCSINDYDLNIKPNKIMQLKLKDWSKYKWCGWASPNSKTKQFAFMKDHEWRFNKKVAKMFDTHAPKHIPDYNFIIDSISVILQGKINHNDKILEIGCATGKTLKKLFYHGFTNLHATESSKDMLDTCPTDIATYYATETIPNHRYKCIVANWTLHFNKNKEELFEKMINALDNNGIIILSEKTSEVQKDIYHSWKKTQGVSDKEIIDKEKSLRDIMFLNNQTWYEELFKKHGLKYKIYNNKMGFITWIIEN